MPDSPSILFVSTLNTTFIQDDVTLLSRHFPLKREIGSGWRAILRITLGLFRSDIVFCWFASVYSSFAVAVAGILGQRSIILTGGVDLACDRDLDYGIWLSPWRTRLVRYALRHATHVLVVDPALEADAKRLAGYDGANITYVPTGYDTTFWRSSATKEPIVLTVAIVKDDRTVRVKGIDLLIAAARRLPGTQFVVVGLDHAIARTLDLPANLEYHPPMPRKDLLPFYARARVYCQPSRREGLPNALCEAMLCQCIPVGTAIAGIVTAIGNTGVMIPSADLEMLTLALGQAFWLPDDHGALARTRIVSLFPMEKREASLLRIIQGGG